MVSGTRVVAVRNAVPVVLNRVRDAPAAWSAGPRVTRVTACVVVVGLQLWWLLRAATEAPSAGATVGAFAMVAGCVLLWPIGRRLGLDGVPAAGAVLLAGAGAILLGVFATAAAGAVLCLALAGVIACVAGRVRLVAAPVALLGSLVAPLAAVPVLVLVAYLVATAAIGRGWQARVRWTVCAAVSLAALAVAGLATGDRPWAVASATPSRSTSLLLVACLLVAGLAWARLRWLRPVAVATVALCGCALVPGTTAGALLIAVPAAAFLAAATLDDRLPGPPARPLVIGLGLAAVLLVPVAALADGVAGAGGQPVGGPVVATPLVEPARAAVAWLGSELDPGHAVAADVSTRALLIGQGLPAERTVPLDPAPVGPHVLVLSVPDGTGTAGSPDASAPVARWVDGSGLGVEVRRPLAPPDEVARSGAARARFGSALSDNPRLELAPDVRRVLGDGGVDPRLMVVLAGLAGSHTIGVGELRTAPGVAPDEAPHRSAVITTVDGAPTTDPAAASVVQDWLAGQDPPYRPEVVARTGEFLRLDYLAPSPLTPPSG